MAGVQLVVCVVTVSGVIDWRNKMTYLGYKKELINCFRNLGAVKKGDFTLASGQKSDIYINAKKILMERTALMYICDMIEHITLLENLHPNCVGGPATGVVPLIGALVMTHHTIRCGFYTRSLIKDHETRQLVEGTILGRPLIVEDVITTGNSVSDTIQCCREIGIEPVGVICVVNRGQLLSTFLGIPYFPLLTLGDLI